MDLKARLTAAAAEQDLLPNTVAAYWFWLRKFYAHGDAARGVSPLDGVVRVQVP